MRTIGSWYGYRPQIHLAIAKPSMVELQPNKIELNYWQCLGKKSRKTIFTGRR